MLLEDIKWDPKWETYSFYYAHFDLHLNSYEKRIHIFKYKDKDIYEIHLSTRDVSFQGIWKDLGPLEAQAILFSLTEE